MWTHKPPTPVLPIAAIFSTSPEIIETAARRLHPDTGEVISASELFDFTITDYYIGQMGPGLRKKLFAFSHLSDPAKLPAWKNLTNSIEQQIAAEIQTSVLRPVNIDIGYLSRDKLVLASTKDAAHRTYLGRGIYAEVTLIYTRKSYQRLAWTYPDFSQDAYISFFNRLRPEYLKRLRDPQNKASQTVPDRTSSANFSKDLS